MSVFQDILFNEKFDQLNNMVRWNGMSRIKDETVAHHSFLVTWFSRILAEGIYHRPEDIHRKLDITTYGAFHDFDEIFTGDILHTVKYNKHNGRNIRAELDSFVDKEVDEFFKDGGCVSKMFRENLLMNNKEIKLVVKVADWLSMGFYIKKEIELGNRALKSKYLYCISSLAIAIEDCLDFFEQMDKGSVDVTILEEIKSINWKYNE